MRRVTLGLAIVAMGLAAVPASAAAQTMPLNEFIATAERIPRNPLALVRSDFRRLKREVEAGLGVIGTAQYRAQQANQPPPTCMPDSFRFDGEDMLRRLKAIPEPRRRTMTITDGLRDVIRRQYPCPAA